MSRILLETVPIDVFDSLSIVLLDISSVNHDESSITSVHNVVGNSVH